MEASTDGTQQTSSQRQVLFSSPRLSKPPTNVRIEMNSPVFLVGSLMKRPAAASGEVTPLRSSELINSSSILTTTAKRLVSRSSKSSRLRFKRHALTDRCSVSAEKN